MRLKSQAATAVLFLLVMGIFLLSAQAADKKAGNAGKQTLTGEISDTMCGAKHMMGSKADCTRECVKGGSDYALVVGNKVYKLKGHKKEELDKLAGERAAVTGTVSEDTVEVKSVTAAKS